MEEFIFVIFKIDLNYFSRFLLVNTKHIHKFNYYYQENSKQLWIQFFFLIAYLRIQPLIFDQDYI